VSDGAKADETEREESEESPPSGEEVQDILIDVGHHILKWLPVGLNTLTTQRRDGWLSHPQNRP
jgi:hypothetical protein